MDRFDDESPAMGQLYECADLFTEWRNKLILNEDKKPRALLANVLTALRHAPEWKGVLRYDVFRYQITVSQPPPWETNRSEWKPRPWSDDDDCRTAEWMQRNAICCRLSEIGPAITSVARESQFHPVREYLDDLKWDGHERIGELAPALFGVPVDEYSSTVFRCMMISAVARIMQPGCKVDTVLTLEGTQGKSKSTAIEALFSKPFFTDDLAELGSKDSAMQMAGVWVVEIADLAAMKRADVDKVKAFITRKVDRFRPPYGKNIIEAPRASIMISTSNRSDWGKDETGGRRFWAVECSGTIDINGIVANRDRLWAEAVALYNAGEPWWLVNEAIRKEAADRVEARYTPDAWEQAISDYVRNLDEVTAEDIMEKVLKMDIKDRGPREVERVGKILKDRFGWDRKRVRKGDSRPWLYFRSAPLVTE